MDRFDATFRSAKSFSDYLAFHVRLLFCATVGQLAWAIPLSDVISSWERGLDYQPSRHIIEFVVAAIFVLYALIMYVYIIRTGWRFLVRESSSRLVRVGQVGLGLGFVLLETAAIFTVAYLSTLQILNLLDVRWERAVCVINAYLSETNYPFTPPKPAFCS